jgi:hypothetical protein
MAATLVVNAAVAGGDTPPMVAGGAAPQQRAIAAEAHAAGTESMLMQELVTSGLSVGCATAVTNPLGEAGPARGQTRDDPMRPRTWAPSHLPPRSSPQPLPTAEHRAQT